MSDPTSTKTRPIHDSPPRNSVDFEIMDVIFVGDVVRSWSLGIDLTWRKEPWGSLILTVD